MKLFRVQCPEHHPSMATWIGGLFLAAAGSPLAIGLLKGETHIEHLPKVHSGFYLTFWNSRCSTCLHFAPTPDTVSMIVDPSVKDSKWLEPAEPNYLPSLKRGSVEELNGKLRLVSERGDDTQNALINLSAGLGHSEFLVYELYGAKLLQNINKTRILVEMSPRQTIVAVRQNSRWWNIFGFNSRRTIEEIHITYDGENVSVKHHRMKT